MECLKASVQVALERGSDRVQLPHVAPRPSGHEQERRRLTAVITATCSKQADNAFLCTAGMDRRWNDQGPALLQLGDLLSHGYCRSPAITSSAGAPPVAQWLDQSLLGTIVAEAAAIL